MTWDGTSRRSQLPRDWSKRRQRVLKRDRYQCQLRYEGCKRRATDADHIARGAGDEDPNLQAACSRCHVKKSSREGHEVQTRLRERRFRPPERHPGKRQT